MLNKLKKTLILFTSIIFCTPLFSETKNYVLREGKKSQERLDLQNDINRDNLIVAFKKAADLIKIEGKVVVDFGCGTSSAYQDIVNIIGPSGKYIGIDSSTQQIELNRSRFKDIHYIVGDENSKEVRKTIASADIIYMRFVVMHQKDQADFLKTIYNLAKSNAIIIIQEPESDDERKRILTKKYSSAAELCDFKIKLGNKKGLNYNFAPNIEPILRSLKPKLLIHNKKNIEIPMAQAKTFLSKTFTELHAKGDCVLNKKEFIQYMDAISKLPEGEKNKWIFDLMHTIIVQKS